MARDKFVIAQLSDLHCGDPRFDKGLLQRAIDTINGLKPDAVAIPGDLSVKGYDDEFKQAAEWISQIQCERLVVVPGNHDERNVGWELYEKYFGERWYTREWDFGVKRRDGVQEKILVVAVDSAKPDLDDGEVGRNRYAWVRKQFAEAGPDTFRMVVMHHHLVSVPGTGRERNIVWDAGDVLEVLEEAQVDLVLGGHKHVPYVWDINGVLVSTSGTVSTWRTRGFTPPSWTLLTISAEQVAFEIIPTSGGATVREVFRRHAKPEMR